MEKWKYTKFWKETKELLCSMLLEHMYQFLTGNSHNTPPSEHTDIIPRL